MQRSDRFAQTQPEAVFRSNSLSANKYTHLSRQPWENTRAHTLQHKATRYRSAFATVEFLCGQRPIFTKKLALDFWIPGARLWKGRICM